MTYTVRAEASRTVIAQDGVDRFAFNDDGSMELLTPVANPTGNKIPTAGQLGFGKMYESPEQAITNGAGLTLAHGLGRAPAFFRVAAICKTAEHGYSVGDVLEVQHVCDVSDTSSVVRGMSLTSDGTNIYVRYVGNTTVFTIINKTTGAVAALSSANWRLIVRAWA